MLHEIWPNFTHNLFKPLLLFFYLGFLIPILKVRFEFPYLIYQGLTMYLLLAIGWHGGEELAEINSSNIGGFAGLMVVGFVLNFVIGAIAYVVLNHTTVLRRIDSAMVAGHYGSDSAGTFAACVGIFTGLGLAFNAYMPVMLAVMEIPGCLVAVYLAGRQRRKGMDAAGFMPDEPGYTPPVKAGAGPGAALAGAGGENLDTQHERGVEQELELSMEKREHPDWEPEQSPARQTGKVHTFSRALLREVFFNPGLGPLVGGIVIGFISALQGAKVVHDADEFFVVAFTGCTLPVSAGDGHDGRPQVERPQVGWARLHHLRSTRAEYLCDARDQRSPTPTLTSPTASSSPELTSCSQYSAPRRHTSPSLRCSGWPSPRRARRCPWPHPWA